MDCKKNSKYKSIKAMENGHMKTVLTHEESQYLFDLGVPKEKASISEDMYGPALFKLEDFLNGEILPKEIETKNGNACLDIQMMNEVCCVSYEYSGHGGCKGYGEGEELIDALYQLACWYYKEFKK